MTEAKIIEMLLDNFNLELTITYGLRSLVFYAKTDFGLLIANRSRFTIVTIDYPSIEVTGDRWVIEFFYKFYGVSPETTKSAILSIGKTYLSK